MMLSIGLSVGFIVTKTSLADEEAGGRFDLDTLIEIALTNNPTVSEGVYAIRQAEAQREIASAQRLPKVYGVGSYTYHDDPQLLAPLSSFEQRPTFSDRIASADIVATLPVFTGGRIRSEILSARLGQDAAEYRLERTRKALIADVSRFYYAILGQKDVVESTLFSRDALREHLQKVEGLISAQRAARVDLLRTEVRLADVEQQLAKEESLLAIQHRALVSLLGLDEAPPGFALQGSLALDVEVDSSLSDSLDKAFRMRDDYAAAKSELGAQEKTVDAARAGRWPTLFIRGSYGGRWADGTVASEEGGADDREEIGLVSLNVEIPLFEGGAIAARVRREEAALSGAREALRRRELAIRLEVEMALLDLDANRKRITATEKAVEQAIESLDIERGKYELGRGTITDVLDAQTALLNAQTQRSHALAAYNTAVAEWRLATGEGQ